MAGLSAIKGSAAQFRRFRPFIVFQGRKMWMLAAMGVVTGFAEAGLLVLVAQIAVLISSGESEGSVPSGPLPVTLELEVRWLFTIAIALSILRVVLQLAAAKLTAHLGSSAYSTMSKKLLRGYLHATWAHQSTRRMGEVGTIINSHTEKASGAVLHLANGIGYAMNFGVLVLAALALNMFAAGAIVVAVLVLFVALRPLNRLGRIWSADLAESTVVKANIMNQTVRLSRDIKVYDRATQVRERSDDALDSHMKIFERNQFMEALVPALYQGSIVLFIVLSLLALYAFGQAGFSSLAAVVLLLLRSANYSNGLQRTYHKLHTLVPYWERVLEAEEAFDKNADEADRGDVLEHIHELRFDNVWFSYRPEVPVLQSVSVTVGGGESVGIVGPSGAGKSTFVQLLLRLRAPEEGLFEVNGQPADDFSLASWSRRISYVPQEAAVFNGSLLDNIRFYREYVSDEMVKDAARRAHIYDEIMELPSGFDTQIGEAIGTMSGGQLQRLSIARALAGDPDMIVLDEPTSALDLQSEAAIRETLEDMKGKVTMFIVAHRLSTLNVCDRIMVFEGGHLVNFDEPAALMESNYFYREARRLSVLE